MKKHAISAPKCLKVCGVSLIGAPLRFGVVKDNIAEDLTKRR